ncbi:MAG: hypothetical protein IKV30_04975 [Clostridia bacterium]|nr:hypothetical protein [Clostridia bacterium]
MKKDLIFTPALVAVGVVLFMLRATGMPAHIAVSVVGVVMLAVYTALTKKDWKIPALEVIMRASYGLALVFGVVIMRVQGVVALAIVHKAAAALFLLALVVLSFTKLLAKKQAK